MTKTFTRIVVNDNTQIKNINFITNNDTQTNNSNAENIIVNNETTN
jgi:hypothetical protein